MSVKTPFASSILTRSLPPPALMTILSNAARSKLRSAEPLSPMSTCSVVGTPACSRSASWSLAPLPVRVSVPLFTRAE